MTNSNYSRLAEIENQKNRRTALMYGGLTVLFIIFLVAFGIRVIAQAAGLLGNSDGGFLENEDNTPPAPPRANFIPEFTNKDELIIEGNSEAGSKIKININDDAKEIITGSDSSFTTTIELAKGKNNIVLTASDNAGNTSTESQTYTVTFDDEKPEIEIMTPTDGAKFYGSGQKRINIEGKTENTASVTINDRIAVLNSDGKFSFSVELGDGENNFNIKSTDKAGNQTEMDVKYSYSP